MDLNPSPLQVAAKRLHRYRPKTHQANALEPFGLPAGTFESVGLNWLLHCLPDVPGWVVGDRGLASDTFRDRIWDLGSRPAIPPKRTDAPVACPPWIYANRHLVENLWARLKEWRAIATRYEKTAKSFLGVLSFAATFDWLRG